ncbi:MAG: hypothetical protein VW450_01045 [Chloroflexota bacterium]
MDATVALLAAVSLGLAGAGLFLLAQGLRVRREISRALVVEHATAPIPPAVGAAPAGPKGPHEPIRDARTARARAEQIRHHSHQVVGFFQQTAPDSPERQWFLNGLTIRTALNMAIMGYGVANLAMATGAGMLLTAIALAGAGIPLALR